MMVFKSFIAPGLGIKVNPEDIVLHEKQFMKALKMMEIWLSKTEYLCGDEITIADISAVCELLQVKFIGKKLTGFPKVEAWQNKLLEIPEIKEAHFVVFKGEQKLASKL